jgi:hypothetical protein
LVYDFTMLATADMVRNRARHTPHLSGVSI